MPTGWEGPCVFFEDDDLSSKQIIRIVNTWNIVGKTLSTPPAVFFLKLSSKPYNHKYSKQFLLPSEQYKKIRVALKFKQ